MSSIKYRYSNVSQIKNKTDDKDLVELAGLHAYANSENGLNIPVNEHDYRVINNISNDSGLNAMTVQNVDTGEYTVVFQGTQVKGKYGMRDMVADIQLLGSAEPKQVKAARAYFDR
ncbi:MAG: hypothetical protein K0Q65_3222 [Clostridia bacterium]|nr:hypothetical protein [Clostridia bacterium]